MKSRVRAERALWLAVIGVLAGCTWVKLSDGGAVVQQRDRAAVENCQRVGMITANTRNKVVVKRGDAKVREELLVLARNEAATLGADTIVATGPAVDGRQGFEAYRCGNATD